MEQIWVLVPITAMVGLFLMIVYLRRYQNAERMSMIDKGVDPTLFTTKQRNAAFSLRAALLFIGAGLGLLVGYFLDRAYAMEEVGYFSMLLIFGGLGLLGSYMIEEKKNKSQEFN